MSRSLRRVDEEVEVLDRAQAGLDGGVAAFVAADRPRAAGVVWLRVERVVATLSEGVADGVDRREVEDVEAHRRDGGEPVGGCFPEAALGPGEQLVPGAEHRPLPVDPQLEGLAGRAVDGVGDVAQGGDELRSCGRSEPGLDGVLCGAQAGDGLVDEGVVAAWLQLRASGLEDQRALLQLQLDVLAGAVLDRDVVDPGGEPVGPRLDHELVQAQVGRLDGAGPQVVVDLGHRRRPPLGLTLRPPPHASREDVVPVPEDVGRDRRRMPHHGLGRVPPRGRSRARADDHDTTGHSYRCTTVGRSRTPGRVGGGSPTPPTVQNGRI